MENKTNATNFAEKIVGLFVIAGLWDGVAISGFRNRLMGGGYGME